MSNTSGRKDEVEDVNRGTTRVKDNVAENDIANGNNHENIPDYDNNAPDKTELDEGDIILFISEERNFGEQMQTNFCEIY